MPRDVLSGFFSRDIIDQEIHQLCENWPVILEDNTIIRKSQGRYRINGRDVSVLLITHEGAKEEEELAHSSRANSLNELAEPALVVKDGPLTQPFLDYVLDTGKEEVYSLVKKSMEEPKPIPSQPLASDLKGGKLPGEGDAERLEAMSLAWTAEENSQALADVPAMPPPPPLPKSSEPVQAAAGVPLVPVTSWSAEIDQKLQAESVVEIIMDLPIIPASTFACHALTSLCAGGQVCAKPQPMGPRCASTAKPDAETREVDVGAAPRGEPPVEPCVSFPSAPEDIVCPECSPSSETAGERRRHRFNEVILPGELDGKATSPIRKAPSKPAPEMLLEDVSFEMI
ncbi:unnamed protein product [Effrenium voratum]|uniref:Uncharacterized protein n=1 Tax=Effrenium voratum TaxID=2562239 RepID=A0AA36I0G4_9DINO|nr:unnamed protein product [Effrenium voratum]CAJ1444667.1 unnamed protein product [Effrenium voratum]